MHHFNRITIRLLVLASLAICFYGYYTAFIDNRFMGMGIIDEEKYVALMESNVATNVPMLTYQDKQLCYDGGNNTYYMSQNLQAQDWEGRLQVPGGKIYVKNDLMMQKKHEAIEGAYEFELLAVLDSGVSTFRLVFTGMPTIKLNSLEKYEHEAGEESYGIITVFDFSTGGRRVQSSDCIWHPRGNTALRYEKKGYKLNLYEEKEVPEKLSLLGMREDNDWILNAMYTDSSKIREKLSLDIWETISDSNSEVNERGSRMEYVEVFIDDEYRGLYGLQEPIDAKQLNLSEEDILYKCSREYDVPTSYMLEHATISVVESVEMVYPKQAEKALWQPLARFLYTFLEKQILNGTGYEDVYFHTQLSNIGDRQIFDQLIYHMDGRLKNEYYVVRTEGDDYQLLFVPWDFNLTFGDCWTEETVTNTYFALERASKLYDSKLNSLWRYYDGYLTEEYYDYLEKRWEELQNLGITEEGILEKAGNYMDYLVTSGALDRDLERWPECENSADLSEIEMYLSVKLPALDQYIESRGTWPIE